jgi:hypothetical protein
MKENKLRRLVEGAEQEASIAKDIEAMEREQTEVANLMKLQERVESRLNQFRSKADRFMSRFGLQELVANITELYSSRSYEVRHDHSWKMDSYVEIKPVEAKVEYRGGDYKANQLFYPYPGVVINGVNPEGGTTKDDFQLRMHFRRLNKEMDEAMSGSFEGISIIGCKTNTYNPRLFGISFYAATINPNKLMVIYGNPQFDAGPNYRIVYPGGVYPQDIAQIPIDISQDKLLTSVAEGLGQGRDKRTLHYESKYIEPFILGS